MANKNEMKVTTLDVLKSYAIGDIVELPPFGPSQPFVARLGRPSLMMLVRDGHIPNKLLVRANEMFMNGLDETSIADENLLPEMLGLLETVAKSTLLSPTYEELDEAGLKLTDEQLMFLFQYSQRGVESLESFRNL